MSENCTVNASVLEPEMMGTCQVAPGAACTAMDCNNCVVVPGGTECSRSCFGSGEEGCGYCLGSSATNEYWCRTECPDRICREGYECTTLNLGSDVAPDYVDVCLPVMTL
jgi:hypothetical protein